MVHDRNDSRKIVTITINKNQYPAWEGEIFLETSVREHIDIPHLCFEKALEPYGACRLCMVEIVTCGKTEMTPACTIRIREGLEILTDTPEIIKHRSILFELYLAQAPKSVVIRNMAARYGVVKTRFLKKIVHEDSLGGKCILCGLCVRICNEIMGHGAINYINRGPYTIINTPFFEENSVCSGCTACASVCPTHAIEFSDIGNQRIMQSWSETRVRLAECRECGKHYVPEKVMNYVQSKLDPGLTGEIKNICPACRRRRIAGKEIHGFFEK
jgi:NADH dehydrogenase/NADH:ubiquinone oxidoreductase subunit G